MHLFCQKEEIFLRVMLGIQQIEEPKILNMQAEYYKLYNIN
jgi:hypothetical protein